MVGIRKVDKRVLREIQRLRGSGLHQDEIAKRVGIDQSTVSDYLNELRKKVK